MPIAITSQYVEIDDKGRARLAGGGVAIYQIVQESMNGYSPDEIHAHFPNLSLAQVHSALAYYYDHREAIDAEIEESNAYAERMRAERPNRFTRKELLDRLERQNLAATPIVIEPNK